MIRAHEGEINEPFSRVFKDKIKEFLRTSGNFLKDFQELILNFGGYIEP